MQTTTKTRNKTLRALVSLLAFATVATHAETVTYTYDPNGNVTARGTAAGATAHGYDALDRLTSDAMANLPALVIGYDANGNRVSQQLEAFSETNTYTPNTNRLVQKGTFTQTLDAAGNLIEDGQGRTYVYNAAGRLSHVQQNGVTIASYLYNAQGQRTRKTTTVGVTVYHYDTAGNLIAETTGTGQPWRAYVYADTLPIAQVQTTGTTDTLAYLHTDHLGTPRAASNAAGTVVWTWESNAFGSLAPNTDPDGDGSATTINLRFPGQYADQETGLYYNWNRYYDPKTGRYIASDQIGLRGGLNTYAYVHANPLRYVDPTGEAAAAALCFIPGIGWVSCATAGAVALTAACIYYGAKGLLTLATSSSSGSGGESACGSDACQDVPTNQPPFTGVPGSTVRGGTGSRTYGQDGYPQTDRDTPHPDECGIGNSDHCHDWGRPSDGGPPTHQDRGPSRAPRPGDPPQPRGPNVPPPK